ncbi:hypothetical protein [Stenotrophomonas sp. 9(2022)]|uniref:hypothetical protein n=1 Tax=Stenotrophomonas sp. 9(2022) TaxID=2950153 RepID=UPI00211553FA|nr:hypothetical protein [Stenotrophomonas sp. 9(2022)]
MNDKNSLTVGSGQPLGEGWSGWATQYPGAMPKLYGAREIAEVNHHPDEGQRLIFLSEQPAQAVDLPYSLDADPAGIRASVCDVITGTLMVGAQGHTPPPAGHWAEAFWNAARADATAQAVDLGKFREPIAAWSKHCAHSIQGYESYRDIDLPDWMVERRQQVRKCDQLLALIDSQAVRNG